jgi:HK97 gp10 family phage protein
MAAGLKWFGDRARAIVVREIDRIMREAGAAWVARARELVPVDTGKLRDSIGSVYDQTKRQLILYCDMPYAGFVEWGTRFAKARPFMRPALSVVPRIFRGSSALELPNVAEKYQERTASFARGKTRGAKIRVGHGKFK